MATPPRGLRPLTPLRPGFPRTGGPPWGYRPRLVNPHALADDDALIAAPATAEETALVEALRQGDGDAFAALIDRYHASLLRVAMSYVATRATAEDVVQETWMGVIAGIGRFEGRSSLKTWVFRILVNRAKTTGVKEHRTIPFSALEDVGEDKEPSVDPSRFQTGTRWTGYWSVPPQSWEGIPEDRLLSGETQAVVTDAIAVLPAMQRAVITLRDVRGFTSQEACEALGVTEGNQRVLLHRARSKVRARLEQHLGSHDPSGVVS
jgi:RNA polymerase sigma-70 factor, ECF subfamily